MNSWKMRQSIRRDGLQLGLVPEWAADANGSTTLTLDHDWDVLPDAGRRLTVAEVVDHVEDLAGRLRAAGVRPGDHVVIHKNANSDNWLLGTATSRIGAIPVMLSSTLDAPTIDALLRRLPEPTLLTDGPKLDVLTDVPLADLTARVLVVGGGGSVGSPLADFAGSPRVAPVRRPLDEIALITHTSGTTGVPKLVAHTPRTMGVRLTPQWRLLSLMRRRETVAVHIPFVHSRTFAAMSLALLRQMPAVLMTETDSDTVVDVFRRNRPGLIEALPNSLIDWEPLAEDARRPFASVKYFSSTFDAIHPRTMSRLVRSSDRRGALFFQIYGQSEVGPAVGRAYSRRSAHRANGRCVGWVMPGCAKVRTVRTDGKRASKEHPGSIEVAWPGLAKTYFAEQDRYDANLKDDHWWDTGDVGYRTKLGCLHMLDRKVDVIPGVGSALEVEDLVLNKLPELTEMVVVHGAMSEAVPVVCTVDDQPLDRERWRVAVADLAPLADPVQITHAEFPRTGTQKVRRIELSRRLEEWTKEDA